MMVQVPLSPESHLGLHFDRHLVFLIYLHFATLVEFSARFSHSNQFGIFRLYSYKLHSNFGADVGPSVGPPVGAEVGTFVGPKVGDFEFLELLLHHSCCKGEEIFDFCCLIFVGVASVLRFFNMWHNPGGLPGAWQSTRCSYSHWRADAWLRCRQKCPTPYA
jgi:hypothetical protein